MKSCQYLCYVAGRSGGHIIPALTHARKEREKNKDMRVLFFSTNTVLDRSLLEKETCIDVYKPLRLYNVPYKKVWLWPVFMLQLLTVFVQTTAYLVRYRPTRIISMGGYISLPVAAVGWLLWIPLEVYELNVVPGEAVKLLSCWADKTHLCFSPTKKYMPARACCIESQYPLRFTEHDRIDRETACVHLGIDSRKKIILILGGSQGSRFINTLIADYLTHANDVSNLFFIHQTGTADVEAVKHVYQSHAIPAIVFAYRSDIVFCYAAADVLVARAGAGTLFEILFFKKRALIIPLETASTGHQKDNAFAMQSTYPELFTVVLQNEVKNKFDIISSFFRPC